LEKFLTHNFQRATPNPISRLLACFEFVDTHLGWVGKDVFHSQFTLAVRHSLSFSICHSLIASRYSPPLSARQEPHPPKISPSLVPRYSSPNFGFDWRVVLLHDRKFEQIRLLRRAALQFRSSTTEKSFRHARRRALQKDLRLCRNTALQKRNFAATLGGVSSNQKSFSYLPFIVVLRDAGQFTLLFA